MQVSKNKPNSSFWTSKNYYKFIRPGAVRIDSYSDNADLLVTAFEQEAGKITFVVINKGTAAVPARIYGNNLPGSYRIYRTTSSENCIDAGLLLSNETTMIFPPSSVTTLVGVENNLLTINQVADTTVVKNSGETVITIDGISNGTGTTSGLTLDFFNSNPDLIGNVSVSEIGTDGKATIRFTPLNDQTGTAQIRLTITSTENITRQVVFYVFVIAPDYLQDSKLLNFRIYPNPSSDLLNVETLSNQFKSFEISDISGRIILSQNILSDHFTVNVSDWNKGVYIIKMNGNNTREIKYFIVK
jgi:hypothetical protein